MIKHFYLGKCSISFNFNNGTILIERPKSRRLLAGRKIKSVKFKENLGPTDPVVFLFEYEDKKKIHIMDESISTTDAERLITKFRRYAAICADISNFR